MEEEQVTAIAGFCDNADATPQSIPFTDDESEKLRNLGKLYTTAKFLILYAEETDPESRSNLQIIKELRDAFDHCMRVIIARGCGEIPEGVENTNDYCVSNLDKAVGHVYRAAFDALDGSVLSLKEKIHTLLKPYSLECIKSIVPEYWEHKQKLETLNARVAQHRNSKDVGKEYGPIFDQYVEDIHMLHDFHNTLIAAGPALDDYMERHQQEQRKSWISNFNVSFGSGLLVGVLLAVLAWGIGKMLPELQPDKKSDATQTQSPPQNVAK